MTSRESLSMNAASEPKSPSRTSVVGTLTEIQSRARITNPTDDDRMAADRSSSRTSKSQSIKIFVEDDILQGIEDSPKLILEDALDHSGNSGPAPASIETMTKLHNTEFPLSTLPSIIPNPGLRMITDLPRRHNLTLDFPKALLKEEFGMNESNIAQITEKFPLPPTRTSSDDQTPKISFTTLFPESKYFVIQHPEVRTFHVDKLLPQPPYHVFDSTKKKLLVCLLSLIALSSPLSASSYFPALNPIAEGFHVTPAFVLITVSVHLIAQGVSPIFWMPLCQAFGRRSVLVAALLTFSAANISLVFSKSFVALTLLRAVQGVGVAPLTAICAAIIGDVSLGKEREKLMGIWGSVQLFTLLIGPLVGGGLTELLGFRSIFWLFFIHGTFVLLLTVAFLPETHRGIAGNGTVRSKTFQRPLISCLKRSNDESFDFDINDPVDSKLSLGVLFEPFQVFLKWEIVLSIILGGIIFGTWTSVLSSMALIFPARYNLSTALVGAAFIPTGAGAAMSFFRTNYLMRRDYHIVEARYRIQHQMTPNTPLVPSNLPDFPLERARLRNTWWITLGFIGTVAGYGFSLSPKLKFIIWPLILQFFIASSATSLLLTNSVLVADLHSGTSVTTALNLVRFSMGALAAGIVYQFLDRLGPGFTFLVMAMIMAAFSPILFLQWFYGARWRRGKAANLQETILENVF